MSAKLLLGLESELTLVAGKIICWMLLGVMSLQSSCICKLVTAEVTGVDTGLGGFAVMMTFHVAI